MEECAMTQADLVQTEFGRLPFFPAPYASDAGHRPRLRSCRSHSSFTWRSLFACPTRPDARWCSATRLTLSGTRTTPPMTATPRALAPSRAIASSVKLHASHAVLNWVGGSRLPDHLHQHAPGLLAILYFSQESHAASVNTVA
jgi:hypothetical protein